MRQYAGGRIGARERNGLFSAVNGGMLSIAEMVRRRSAGGGFGGGLFEEDTEEGGNEREISCVQRDVSF